MKQPGLVREPLLFVPNALTRKVVLLKPFLISRMFGAWSRPGFLRTLGHEPELQAPAARGPFELILRQDEAMKPILIAHRGASAMEPENTLAAFRKALEFPFVEMIELDVYALPSGELMVIHDARVDRTTNGKGYVMASSFAYLRSLDAGRGRRGRKREPIPTLNEVLDLIDRKVKVNIELKGEHTAEPVRKIITKYGAKGWKQDDFLVSSFNHEELAKFKQLMPGVPIGVLISGKPPPDCAEYAQGLKAYSLNLAVKHTTKKIVDDAQRRGLKVFCWTLQNAREIQRLHRLGVDGMFVNDPKFAYGVLNGAATAARPARD
jgi:glycerophosphoryl diester phosphodiesterase